MIKLFQTLWDKGNNCVACLDNKFNKIKMVNNNNPICSINVIPKMVMEVKRNSY